METEKFGTNGGGDDEKRAVQREKGGQIARQKDGVSA